MLYNRQEYSLGCTALRDEHDSCGDGRLFRRLFWDDAGRPSQMPKSHEDERDGRCPPEEVMDVEEVDGFEDSQTDEEVRDVGCKDIEGAEPEDVCPVITQ